MSARRQLGTIFVAIPSYSDPDLPATLDSAIRMSSGGSIVHLAVCEQVTLYAAGYLLGRELPEHVFVSVDQVGDRLIGLGGARHLAESFYGGEGLQVQVDSHTRFDSDWDVRIVEMCDRLGDGIASANMPPDPWSYAGRIPVVRLERFANGIPAGHVEMVEPPSGRLSELIPARAVVGGGVVGRAWCADVPADPHIMFGGEEPALAARLYTAGRDLYAARMPFRTARAGERPPNRPWERPEWAEMNDRSYRRVQALLDGTALPVDDAAGHDLDRYGLGDVRTLADWTEYSGLDYKNLSVRTPWPENDPESP